MCSYIPWYEPKKSDPQKRTMSKIPSDHGFFCQGFPLPSPAWNAIQNLGFFLGFFIINSEWVLPFGFMLTRALLLVRIRAFPSPMNVSINPNKAADP